VVVVTPSGARIKRRPWRGRRPLIVAEANPKDADVLETFRFFAIIKTWMDEDIVEATVKNAFAQGVEAVYVVDNASTDATVERALTAGAVLAESYETDVFEGRIPQVLMNAVVARVSLSSRAPHVWWLYLDTDEFPEGPDDMTVAEYLVGLDRRFRIVGSTYFNHVPSGKPEYIEGFHPIDFQPLCEQFLPARNPPCESGHWKHPLQRFDRDGLFVASDEGYHTATIRTHVALAEPLGGIRTHHFQYRDEQRTRAKLEMTCGPGSNRTALHQSIGNAGFAKRRKSLDAVYSQRWGDVVGLANSRSSGGLVPEPWPDPTSTRRWYRPEELTEARTRWLAGPEAPAPRR